jgi:3-deoxy-D-manno-octulosonic-acid transferase
MRPAAASLAEVLAQTADDAGRFSLAGAMHVRPVGNLKFDMSPDTALLERGAAWRAALERHAPGRTVVLAASWREGEDAELIAAWKAWSAVKVGEGHARPLLVVVPRHPQRFDEVQGLWRAAGVEVARRSRWAQSEPGDTDCAAEVWLGDSMREMPAYYALADVALLGGSFACLGGQNLIEAAACGCPVIAGPHTFNFAEAMQAAIEESAAVEVPDVAAALASIAPDRDRQTVASGQQRRAQASAFAAAHRGAAHRMARHVLDHLGG